MMCECNLTKKELEERLQLAHDQILIRDTEIGRLGRDLQSAHDQILIKDSRIENIEKEREDLRETIRQRDQTIKQQNHEILKHLQKRKKLMHIIKTLKARLRFYENPDSPPSCRTLKDEEIKSEKKEKENAAEKGGTVKVGGRKGHPGASRSHNPERTVVHEFESAPVCECGHAMTITGHGIRDILDIPEIQSYEIRHKTEHARCSKCGETRDAPNGLPAKGSYGRNLVGLVAELRSRKMTHADIAGCLDSTIPNFSVSKSTIISMISRASDAMKPENDRIIHEIQESDRAGIDETGMPLGEYHPRGYAWAMQSGSSIFITFHRSRGSYVMDRYMDGYKGVVVTDGCNVYKRFDAERHQLCWAHELRHADDMARNEDGCPDARRLHEDMQYIYSNAKASLREEGHSPELRQSFQAVLDGILEQYRTTENKELRKLVERLERGLPILFTFLQYPVEPTNNATERVLRYVVVFRKISGQIKGGPKAMERWSNFMTCVMTWRARGLSVFSQVRRII